ncbi:FUN14 family protein [Planctomycetes bacterium Poly30]|uniref:FUN14 family protein n=1 Tax=Saltatorellus ferox TaxID=2528018 RepID=A0A518ENJ0_9BACT|nr:FUN14 family protein [Planctomycetes bacterium Poly30]
MTNEDIAVESAEQGEGGIGSIALWKKALVVLSLVLGCVGLAMGSSGQEDTGARVASSDGTTLVQPSAFGPGTPVGGGIPANGTEGSAAQTLWAPLFAKGGLSFFIAFCIGYALRTFLKGTMLVIGVVALAVFGLQKAGLVDNINWEKAQGYWDSLTANLGEQFDSFKTFVSGSLPSAASGGVGLLAGFRR